MLSWPSLLVQVMHQNLQFNTITLSLFLGMYFMDFIAFSNIHVISKQLVFVCFPVLTPSAWLINIYSIITAVRCFTTEMKVIMHRYPTCSFNL